MIASSIIPILALASVGVLAPGLLEAAPLRIVSTQTSVSVSASGDSFAPMLSADGRFLFFLSHAGNLVANDEGRPQLDLFRHDLTNGQTTLVSIRLDGLGGANDDVTFASVSSNGQFVAFASDASNLTAGDTNHPTDVFVRDCSRGITRRFNIDVGWIYAWEIVAPLAHPRPLISSDGQRVVFEGQELTSWWGIYARDLGDSTNLLVSVNTNGTMPNAGSESATLSRDGRVVGFISRATDLGGSLDSTKAHAYVRDLEAGVTHWASECLATNAMFSGYGCLNPSLSADGNYLCFLATNANHWPFLVRYEVGTGQSVVVASNALSSTWPVLSADGRYVSYAVATNFWGPGSRGIDVFRWDAQTSSNELVSVNLAGTGPGNGPSRGPLMTPDGSKIVFLSEATDLVTNACNGQTQIYMHDMAARTTRLISVAPDGAASRSDFVASTPAISEDGRLVAFASEATDLASGDLNQASDIFVRDLQTETTRLISVADPGRPRLTASGASSTAAMGDVSGEVNSRFNRYSMKDHVVSADGRFVVFSSYDSDLISGDTNGWQDVFVRDMQTGLIQAVSAEPDGFSTNRSASQAAISADGRHVFFTIPSLLISHEMSLDVSGLLYWRDLQSTSSILVSAGLTGVGRRHFYSFSPSRDGRWVAFQTGPSRSSDIWLRDVLGETNELVNLNWQGTGRADGTNAVPQVSPDGRYVAFASSALDLVPTPLASPWNLYVYDRMSRSNKLITLGTSDVPSTFKTDVAFSGDSRMLAYAGTTTVPSIARVICVYDLVAGTSSVVCTNCWNPSLSQEGAIVAFESRDDSWSTDYRRDVWLKDLQTGNSVLVSTNLPSVPLEEAEMPGGGHPFPRHIHSTSPTISPDGRYVVFVSEFRAFLPLYTNNSSEVFVYDRQLGKPLLVSMNRFGTGPGNGASLRPVLGADGRTIVFVSYASDLVEGDYNNQRGVFLVRLGPVLKLTRAGGGPTTIFWNAEPGRAYRVQFKDSLSDPVWSEFPQTVVPETTTGAFTDDAPSAFGQRYYQVIEAL